VEEITVSQIQGKLLYHISRENNWEIGQTVVAGEQENPFWGSFKKYNPQESLSGEKLPLRKILRKYSTCPWDVSQNTVNLLYQHLKDMSTEFAFYVREQTFESVRKECFPQRPSRQKCLWLTDKNQIPYWLTLNPKTPRSLLTLDLCGEIFCGDAYWLEADSFSSFEYVDRAQRYWSGEWSCNPRIEYMFCGTATVKRIVLLNENLSVQEIMVTLFDQEKVMEIHDYHIAEAARKDGIQEGRAEGQIEGTLTSIKNLMETLGLSIEAAMNALKVPEDERTNYTNML